MTLCSILSYSRREVDPELADREEDKVVVVDLARNKTT